MPSSNTSRGISPLLLLAAIAAVGWGVFSGGHTPPGPNPAPAPQPVSGVDLAGVFSANADRAAAAGHAALFGAICRRCAATIEADGKRGPDARITTGAALAQYRADLRYAAADGWSFAQQYPTLKTAVGAHLDKIAGTEAGDLTPEARAAWVRAFSDLGAAAEYAAHQLR